MSNHPNFGFKVVKDLNHKSAWDLHKFKQWRCYTALMIEPIGLDGYLMNEFATHTSGQGRHCSIALS
jgi:hypothetical protein